MRLKYDENGLIPAIVQDDQGRVLMMAYMNEEAFNKTLQTGETWFYSRRRQGIWHKGEQGGNIQQVKRITVDCDRDSLLITVNQHGHGACDDEEGEYSCFHNILMSDGQNSWILSPLGKSYRGSTQLLKTGAVRRRSFLHELPHRERLGQDSQSRWRGSCGSSHRCEE